MPFGLTRHKVEVHKVRQITIRLFTSYLNQIVAYIFRQQNDRKNSTILTFEK